MLMLIASVRLDLFIPAVHSLKEKRSVLKSVIARLRNEFNASVAEVDEHDRWQRGVIGVVCVGNETRYLEGQIDAIIRWIEQHRPDVTIVDIEREML